MSARDRYRGVFAVLPTPFDGDGALDQTSLERCVHFCVASGADGLVVPVNASEFTTLTTQERKAVVEVVVRTTADALPVVVGVSAESTTDAVDFARHARSVRATAVIAMAPYREVLPDREVLRHFAQVQRAFEGPVFIQSYHAYPASRLSVPLMAQIVTDLQGTWYVKEETYPAGQRMTELLRLAGGSLSGVMGGMAGRYLIDEYARGACGTMPACEVLDVHVALWRALEAGDHRRADDIHGRLLPLLNFEQLYGPLAYKEVLRRRGVICHATTRDAVTPSLDPFDHHELDRLLAKLGSLLTTGVAV